LPLQATEPSATGRNGAPHSTWLENKTTKPLLLKVPLTGNPAQHKTPQSYRGVADVM